MKQIEAELRREETSTMDGIRKVELTRELSRMGHRKFSTERELYTDDAAVSFALGREAFDLPVVCRTLYVACPVNDSALHLLTRWVAEHGLIVVYV
ncbi:hypothetical protein [Pseudofrankia sp. BMG5.36]|uniref:hypothetical protein n=1 Tax=Pseudofrankia sp. BMG5.36 TaxID=1834512 RepID=UPI0010424793|nr:hypothetical protein [Pseudofrankia sp. BMG5.36]